LRTFWGSTFVKETFETLARALLEIVPFTVRLIREEMRRHCGADLTFPQFQTHLFLQRNPGMALDPVADHPGLTPTTFLKMVTRLLSRGMIERPVSASDRRRVELRLRARGNASIVRGLGETVTKFAERLENLHAEEREKMITAPEQLHKALRGKNNPPTGQRRSSWCIGRVVVCPPPRNIFNKRRKTNSGFCAGIGPRSSWRRRESGIDSRSRTFSYLLVPPSYAQTNPSIHAIQWHCHCRRTYWKIIAD
jgi:MarR family transcriptional regulator, temperature-dependent positive regulator of motility